MPLFYPSTFAAFKSRFLIYFPFNRLNSAPVLILIQLEAICQLRVSPFEFNPFTGTGHWPEHGSCIQQGKQFESAKLLNRLKGMIPFEFN